MRPFALSPDGLQRQAIPKTASRDRLFRVGYGRSPQPIQCPLFNLGAVVRHY